MAKRPRKGDASFGSPSKRFRSSSAASEPQKTSSLLTLWNIPSPAASDKAAAQTLKSTRKTTHSTVASVSLCAPASSGSGNATPRVEKRHERQQQPIRNGHASDDDLAVVTTFDLPTEVLEMILCQLNIRDLYFSCRLVCKRWNDVVTRDKVIMSS